MAFPIFETLNVTITSGAAVSDTANVRGRDVVGIVMPSGWDAAALTFRVSVDGANFADAYTTGGTEISYTVGAVRFIPVQGGTFSGMQGLALRSGTVGTPVNQTADRTLGIVVRSHI